MLAWLTDQTRNNWIFITTMVTAFLVVAGAVWGVSKWVIQEWRRHQLFEAYYELDDNNIAPTYRIKPSTNTQHICVTLKMKAAVYIDFINLAFKGNVKLPQITGISDKDLGTINRNILISIKDGIWKLSFIKYPYYHRDQRIRISVSYKVPNTFNGRLKVFLSCDEGVRKSVLLPFKVEDYDVQTTDSIHTN